MITRIPILLLTASSVLSAQGSTSGFGTMELPFTARNASMAEANAADRSNGLTSLLNPALLAGTQTFGISVSHQSWMQDIRSNFLFVNVPFSFLNVGLSVSTTSVGGIEIRDAPGPAIGEFDARTAIIAGTAAYEIEPNVGIGATFKYVYEKIYVEEASSVLFDVGAFYRPPVEGLSAGVSLQHLGFAGALRKEKAKLPTQARIGLAYETIVDDFRILGVLAGTSRSTGTSFRVHTGAECTYAGLVSVRVGYQTGFEARAVSGGLGLFYGNFSFDYGTVPFSLGLGTGHLLTLGYRF